MKEMKSEMIKNDKWETPDHTSNDDPNTFCTHKQVKGSRSVISNHQHINFNTFEKQEVNGTNDGNELLNILEKIQKIPETEEIGIDIS